MASTPFASKRPDNVTELFTNIAMVTVSSFIVFVSVSVFVYVYVHVHVQLSQVQSSSFSKVTFGSWLSACEFWRAVAER